MKNNKIQLLRNVYRLVAVKGSNQLHISSGLRMAKIVQQKCGPTGPLILESSHF